MFWKNAPSLIPAGAYGARNLYEIFVHDLSSLVSGACQANQAAHALYRNLPEDEICLRRVVLGLSQASRAFLPHLPPSLIDEGLVLPPTHDVTVGALLATIHPETCGNLFEPWSVIGTRIVSVLRHVARYLEAKVADAAEIAGLLGSLTLQAIFGRWAQAWKDYLSDLRSRELGFRVQAYAAGMINNLSRRQSA